MVYGWCVKVCPFDIRLSSRSTLLQEEEDILLDRKGARHVNYLSGEMGFGVHAVAANSDQILGTQ
ncbi:MAG: hypothetical protein ACJ700_05075 [Nitrososphaera sp.]